MPSRKTKPKQSQAVNPRSWRLPDGDEALNAVAISQKYGIPYSTFWHRQRNGWYQLNRACLVPVWQNVQFQDRMTNGNRKRDGEQQSFCLSQLNKLFGVEGSEGRHKGGDGHWRVNIGTASRVAKVSQAFLRSLENRGFISFEWCLSPITGCKENVCLEDELFALMERISGIKDDDRRDRDKRRNKPKAPLQYDMPNGQIKVNFLKAMEILGISRPTLNTYEDDGLIAFSEWTSPQTAIEERWCWLSDVEELQSYLKLRDGNRREFDGTESEYITIKLAATVLAISAHSVGDWLESCPWLNDEKIDYQDWCGKFWINEKQVLKIKSSRTRAKKSYYGDPKSPWISTKLACKEFICTPNQLLRLQQQGHIDGEKKPSPGRGKVWTFPKDKLATFFDRRTPKRISEVPDRLYIHSFDGTILDPDGTRRFTVKKSVKESQLKQYILMNAIKSGDLSFKLRKTPKAHGHGREEITVTESDLKKFTKKWNSQFIEEHPDWETAEELQKRLGSSGLEELIILRQQLAKGRKSNSIQWGYRAKQSGRGYRPRVYSIPEAISFIKGQMTTVTDLNSTTSADTEFKPIPSAPVAPKSGPEKQQRKRGRPASREDQRNFIRDRLDDSAKDISNAWNSKYGSAISTGRRKRLNAGTVRRMKYEIRNEASGKSSGN